jgi:hypothetical protein
MAAPDPRLPDLLELLVSAAASPTPAGPALVPAGVPISDGRFSVGRLSRWLPDGEVAVVTGFATACWLGSPTDAPPSLGRHVYRSFSTVSARNRLRIDHRSRAWLAVADASFFDAVPIPWTDPLGLLLVPVEDYARRVEAVTP